VYASACIYRSAIRRTIKSISAASTACFGTIEQQDSRKRDRAFCSIKSVSLFEAKIRRAFQFRCTTCPLVRCTKPNPTTNQPIKPSTAIFW
jgi:hypothetical protein